MSERTTMHEAKLTAEKIRAYWMRRGFVSVEVRVEPGEYTHDGLVSGYVVRSNMINGVPPGPRVPGVNYMEDGP